MHRAPTPPMKAKYFSPKDFEPWIFKSYPRIVIKEKTYFFNWKEVNSQLKASFDSSTKALSY
jgi:hypothetical protein